MRYGALAGWSVDFIRAARDRPLWARLLMRVAMGKWAYREFIGLMDELDRGGFIPYFDYELTRMEYHKDAVPFDWGKERRPVSLRSADEDEYGRHVKPRNELKAIIASTEEQ